MSESHSCFIMNTAETSEADYVFPQSNVIFLLNFYQLIIMPSLTATQVSHSFINTSSLLHCLHFTFTNNPIYYHSLTMSLMLHCNI